MERFHIYFFMKENKNKNNFNFFNNNKNLIKF